MLKISTTITLLKNFFIHLRLKFSLFLAPIYLYGVIIGNGNIFTLEFLTQFITLHVFLYGGVFALNDYYDRDEHGPVGGLQNPPLVKGHSLFYLAWLWKLSGLYLSVIYSSSASSVLTYVVCILMSVAYSHPKIRLKGNPFWSTLVVVLLQGFLIYYSGTVLSNNNVFELSPLKFWMGTFVIIFLTLGSYPLTQVYQIEQDSCQGNRTLAIYLGVEKTFQFASFCLLISGILNSLLIGYYYHWWEGVIIFISSFLFQYNIQKWKNKFERQTVVENFKSLDRLFSIQTVYPFMFCIAHLLHIL
jgi:4-hydroxybenzoate polyprenyltransferase